MWNYGAKHFPIIENCSIIKCFKIHTLYFVYFIMYYFENLGSWSTAQNLFARKNWSTQFFICSTPFEQMSLFWSTGQKLKIICRTCISSSFTFRKKNINCLNCNWLTKVLENVNCSTQLIVKKMVYMYGS